MDHSDLCHAAALIAAAFVARKGNGTPEDAARTYFHCLDTLVAVDEERRAKQRETERQRPATRRSVRLVLTRYFLLGLAFFALV